MNWGLFFDLTVSGLTLGSLYALIALGYSMVYGILKLLNFAHGDVYMIGAFLGWYALHALGGPLNPTVTGAFVLFLMFIVAMLGCGVLGVAIERFAYRPLRNAPRIAPLISALGVSIFLQNSALLIFGASFRDYNTFELIGVKTYNVGHLFFSVPQLLTVVAAVFLMVALTVFVARSRLGKAMRSTSYDREAASMMGIDVDRVISVTFFIGSALAGAAGVMFALVFGQIYHFMGFIAGLKGFTAAVIGGIGSIPGAMVGGLIVGLAESYATGYLPQGSTFQNLYVFALLILVILIRPSGLFGKAAISKV
ncbi:MAG: branched-chain amino acid transport system permease protein [Gaiellaceae bacterium]|nr:branched-chain amino acid transport system permease protein [Gaiellaceae bacterium]